MDCRLMAGVDLWRAKLPKVAAEGGIVPPPPSLAASVAAPLEDNHTLRAAKVRSRSRDGSSVGDALNSESLLMYPIILSGIRNQKSEIRNQDGWIRMDQFMDSSQPTKWSDRTLPRMPH
ncbi:hypothetical protein PCANC_22740 [Puccinia coronata f. sp. avenae]|uniref:Uncharacterized protein n=1 Tax=Puccinia coronata f. sp. avenae TaxID=200324 RepID=A0A2N5U9P6_9BASI|nr:hypothetical protein PCANC_22740 [Puccinia coronata f. sp. avenae]